MGIGSLFHTRARALPTGSVPLTGPVEAGDIVGLAGQVDITGEQALAVPAVLRGVTLLSSAAAALPLRVLDDRGAEVAGTVLADPNPGLSSTELVRQVAWSMLVEGDAFLLVTGRDAFGYPTDVQVVSPRLVGVELDPNTNLPRYRVGGQEWPRADVVHIPYQADPGAIRGTSPLRRCRQAIAAALGEILFAGAYYGQGGAPTVVLKVNSPDLTPAEAVAIKAGYTRSQRTRTPLVLNATTDLQDNKISAEAMELVAAQQFAVAEVSRVLGLSPEDLGGSSGGSLTYSSPAARRDEFQRLALLPVVVAIEDGLSRLLPPGQRADVDMDAGLRPLQGERWANYALAIQAGFLDPGTAAQLEGLPAPTPRPAADPSPQQAGSPRLVA